MHRFFRFPILAFACLVAPISSGEELLVLAEDWPPYNYLEDGELVGLSADLVREVLAGAGISTEIRVQPWKRAYETASSRPNTLLFSTSRTEEREDRFLWIGPLWNRELYLYKLRDRDDIRVESFEDLRRWSVGVVRGGSVEELLRSGGLREGEHFWPVAEERQNLRKLFQGRIDLAPCGADPELEWNITLAEHGYRAGDLEKAFLLTDEGGYYVAAHPDTSADLVVRLQQVLDRLLADGARERIRSRYLAKQSETRRAADR